MVAQHTINTILVLQFIASLYYTEGLPQYKMKYYRKQPMSRKPPSSYRVRPWRMYQHRHHHTENHHHVKSYSDIKPSAQSWTPFYENSVLQTNLNEEQPLRKLTIYNKPTAPFTIPKVKAPPKGLFENFVTPKESGGYEVTTKKFEDSEPDPLGLPLGADPDLAIALDDEEGGEGEEEARGLYSYRPEHRNPLVYVDSYGRPLGDKQRTATGARYHGKSAGRVRMQVFRGPTRLAGHGHEKKKWAQWGYYVVQPAATSPHHSYPHSPYPY